MAGLFTQWKNEGYNEGLAQGIATTVKNLLKFKTCTIEQIAQATGLSVEEVQKLNEEAGV